MADVLESAGTLLVEPVTMAAFEASRGAGERILRVVDGGLTTFPDMARQPGAIVLTDRRIMFVPEARRKRLGGFKQPSVQSYGHTSIRSLGFRLSMLHVAGTDREGPAFGDWFLEVGNEQQARAFAQIVMDCPDYAGDR